MHRRGSYHYPKAQAAKQHLATNLPEDIEGLESVVKPVRSAIKSLHRLHAKHLEKTCAKVSTVISYLIVKKNKASAQGFGDWVCETKESSQVYYQGCGSSISPDVRDH